MDWYNKESRVESRESRGKSRESRVGSFVFGLIVCFFLFLPFTVAAQNSNARQARHMFDQTYNMVFGPQGSSLHYDVNIIGVYKTNGTIWYKGKKSKFQEPRMTAWNDGNTYIRMEPKKQLVTIYNANDENRDKYASKFTFVPDNYTYSIALDPKGYVITLRAKKGVSGIKEGQILLDKHTRYPIHVRIKLGFMWTTIKITNFKSGGISDDLFVFPRSKYAGYKVVDMRK
ncbi:MAG: hypothetical protein J5610_04520 [Prevotella sp.]|nr:hypothetical protein [Prevotella sp.]